MHGGDFMLKTEPFRQPPQTVLRTSGQSISAMDIVSYNRLVFTPGLRGMMHQTNIVSDMGTPDTNSMTLALPHPNRCTSPPVE
ncbi:MAG: hypothetical protein Ct9H300mP19_07110 [Dehalococcoidia bacterium]|nr:MAG: hypothetical protein Ct9H300mP19_07110 [Dehalococcoidia bacterium]